MPFDPSAPDEILRQQTKYSSNNGIGGAINRANATIAQNELNRRAAKKKQYDTQFANELSTFDQQSGKFYDLMRQGFRQRTEAQSAAQQTGSLAALQQGAARSGLSFSGVEQAANVNLQGQIGQAKQEALSGYDQKLNELRQTQRDAFVQGQFDFFHQLQQMDYQNELNKNFQQFQADMADKYNSGWNKLFGVIGQGIGMFAGGAFGNPAQILGFGQQQVPQGFRAY